MKQLACVFFLGATGCSLACFNDSDCTEGQVCNLNGACETEVHPEVATGCTSLDCFVLPASSDGWDDRPGTGLMFVVNQIAIAGQDRGFDVDGDGDIDNALWQLGSLNNDLIRQSLLGGEGLVLIELAGWKEDVLGPQSLTVKIYPGRDADDPFFPANNFKVPPGHVTCCEFLIEGSALVGSPPQAPMRLPAVLYRGRVTSVGPGAGSAPLLLALADAQISFRLPADKRSLNEGLIGGVVPFSVMASTDNPFCSDMPIRTQFCVGQEPHSLLTLVTQVISRYADIDRDGDGKECLIDVNGTGAYACCDGPCEYGTARCERPIAPIVPGDRLSCASADEMADGMSMTMTFTAVRASVVGFR